MNLPNDRSTPGRSTIVDVARLSGVAPATVSKALDVTGRYGLSDEVRRRVMEVAERLGYRSRSHGRRALRSKLRLVGLVHGRTEPHSGRSAEILETLAQTLAAHDHNLLHFSCSGDLENLRSRLPSEHRISGWLGVGQIGSAVETVLKELGQPVVLLNGSVDCPFSQVLPDEGGAADLLVRHLFEMGHSAIVLCAAAAGLSPAARLGRIEGYRAAMRRLGLHDQSRVVQRSEELLDGQWRAALTQPTAVIADTLSTAMSLLEACRQSRVSVPEQLSIASFDDDYPAEHLNPPLTAVRARLEQAAREASSLLLDQIEARQSTLTRKVLVGSDLTVRASTARPGGGQHLAKSA
jgi:LacI family transcriptional regulator